MRSHRNAIQANLTAWMDGFVARDASEVQPVTVQTVVGKKEGKYNRPQRSSLVEHSHWPLPQSE